MNKVLLLRMFLSVACWSVASPGISGSAPSEKLPKNFKLNSLFGKGTLTTLSTGEGFRIVDFWASWCQSCKTNLEKLELLQKKLEHQRSPSQILALSVDESRVDAKNFFDSDGPGAKLTAIRKNAWLDTKQKLSYQLAFEGLPYLIVVDAKGAIVMRHSGALSDGDIKKIENKIKSQKTFSH